MEIKPSRKLEEGFCPSHALEADTVTGVEKLKAKIAQVLGQPFDQEEAPRVHIDAGVLAKLRTWAHDQPHYVVKEEVTDIAERVIANVGEEFPIHRMMRRVLRAIEAARELPQEPGMGLLLDAKAAFYSLPELERNAIFGGWKMNEPETPNQEGMAELVFGQRPRGFLSITDHRLDLYGCVEWYWDEASTSPVRLSIVEGTSQEHAIKTVEADAGDVAGAVGADDMPGRRHQQ